MIEGTIVAIFEKGFGFINVDGYDKNVFFHASDCGDVAFDTFKKGDEVLLKKIITSAKGYSAVSVSPK